MWMGAPVVLVYKFDEYRRKQCEIQTKVHLLSTNKYGKNYDNEQNSNNGCKEDCGGNPSLIGFIWGDFCACLIHSEIYHQLKFHHSAKNSIKQICRRQFDG